MQGFLNKAVPSLALFLFLHLQTANLNAEDGADWLGNDCQGCCL